MKKILFSAAIIPLLLLIMAFKPTTTIVSFEQSDWDNSKSRATSEGKLYFVDFDASYCATCRNMDESTYMNQQLADYMTANVVALRVDVQDFDGVMWSQQYEVEALPTMLIFDAQGKLVKRLVGYKSAADLMQEFDAVKNSSAKTTSKTTLQPIAPDVPMSATKTTTTSTATTGGYKPVLSSNTTVVKTNTSTTTSSNNYVPSDALLDNPQPTGLGLYDVTVNKQASQGFGVQVGVFSSYEGVLEEASRYQRKYSKKTIIHIDEHNGSVVYKLLLGVFTTKIDASHFRYDLRKDNTDGLIKDLRTMR